MKLLKSKTILAGGVLASLFVGAIFISCHSIPMATAQSSGYSHGVLITQTSAEPCCMTQKSNFRSHSWFLAVAPLPATSLDNAFKFVGNAIWLSGAFNETRPTNLLPQPYGFDYHVEAPHSYLKNFIAQGLLEPKLYNPSLASV